MRRLWRGEVIFNHDGPIGKYQILVLDPDFNEDIRLALVAFGPNTLRLGGRVFDDVILHTYFTPETVKRCVRTVKEAAEQAGRDPESVRVWSCFATVGDHLPEDLRMKKTVARLATYLQGYGDLMVTTNGWNPAVLQRFRGDAVVQSIGGGIDHKASADQIEHILPPDVIASLEARLAELGRVSNASTSAVPASPHALPHTPHRAGATTP
jgi:alkanesulfonate monooxygenase SsuD/methylene tetrahydromethanopterin reductase-like flavin-dependent oxidoreductase (luciferase family)